MKATSRRRRLAVVLLLSAALLAGLWAFLHPERWRLHTGDTADGVSFTLSGEITGVPWLHQLWHVLYQVKWSLAGMLAALILGLWLLRHFIKPRNRRTYSILCRSLVASLLVHLLLAFFFSLWVVSEAILEAVHDRPLEVAVDADALAQERLALEIREQLTALPPAPPLMPVEHAAVERLPLPEIAMVREPAVVAPPPQPFAMETQKPSAPELLPATKAAPPLPPINPPKATVAMELRQQKPQDAAPEVKPLTDPSPTPPPKVAAPVDPGRPVVVMPELRVLPTLNIAAAMPETRLAPVAAPSPMKPPAFRPMAQMETVRPQPTVVKAPESNPVDSSSGIVAMKATTPLPDAVPAPPPPTPSAVLPRPVPRPAALMAEVAPTSSAATRLPALPQRPDIKLEAPAQPGTRYMLRDPSIRDKALAELGGNGESEGAIKRSLDWFTRNQEADGHWAIQRFGGQGGHDVAATGLVTLCYLGWGATHQKDGPYKEPVGKAIKWLAAKIKSDGDLRGEGGNMYDQGIAAIALAEAYGLTKDPGLREPVEKITGYIVRAQNAQTGGWRYQPGEAGDTSVFGWQLIALKSAELAGIPVPPKTFDLANKWLDSAAGGSHAGLYGYQDRNPKPAMVAEAMFARQLLGTPRDAPKMQESAEYLKTILPDRSRTSFYFWYYGSLALYQHQGPVWEEWNQRLRQLLVSTQKQTGNEQGSWDPTGERGGESGRAVATAMATLSLEVYYRYLPIYNVPVK